MKMCHEKEEGKYQQFLNQLSFHLEIFSNNFIRTAIIS